MDQHQEFLKRLKKEEFTLTCPFPCCVEELRLSYDDANKYIRELDTQLLGQMIDLEIEVKGREAFGG